TKEVNHRHLSLTYYLTEYKSVKTFINSKICIPFFQQNGTLLRFTGTTSWRFYPSNTMVLAQRSGMYDQRVVAAPAVVDHGDQPAGDKQPNHHKTGVAEVIVDGTNAIPDAAAEGKFFHQQPKRFQPADKHRHHHRGTGNGHVVVELALRLVKCPTVSPHHQQVVEGIHQRHAAGEKRR